MMEPLICITFDDGYETDRTIVYEEMTARDLRGTTYLVTEYVDKYPGQYLTSAQIEEMKEEWDFQCHLHHHRNLPQEKRKEKHRQFRKLNEKFAELELPYPEHIAYPFGAIDYETIEITKKYRRSGRTVERELLDYDDFDMYKLPSHSLYINSSAELNEKKELVDQAISENKCLLIYRHEIQAGTEGYFTDFLDYVVSCGIKSVNHSELFNILSKLQQ